MTIATQPGNGPGLRRALGTFDLVLLNIAAIVGLRWLSTAAQLGPASLTLWIIAFLLFFVPSALTVQELSSRIPHVGGLYRWTQAAFGDTHGFLAGWAYWVSNLVYFPSVLLFVSGVILHVAGPSLRPLAENPLYNGLFCLALLWGVTFLNILGLRRAKWLQNIGGLASLAIGAQVLIGGAVAWWRFGSATHVSLASLAPDLNSLPTLNTFAILILAFVGLELGPILGDEIRNSARSIRRAIMISGVAITVIYVAGTASLLVALPPGQIGVISGIPEAMEATGQRIGMPSFGMVAAALLAITSAGGLGAWITGTARLPFVMGLGHYLPGKLGAIHPRHGTPHVALLVQAAATSVVLLGAISGSTVHEAYLLLIDMTAALSCAVWVYTFAALPVLRRRGIGERADVALIPGGTRVGWLVAWIGVLATTFATVVSLIPPEGSAHPMLFVIKGAGGCVLVFAVGLLICHRGRTRTLNAQAAAGN
ncbi:MAG: amino acid permease [Gammaproteobacteria bacterium]|nr:amino acid permease [Gammaproteobacteria bacterium]